MKFSKHNSWILAYVFTSEDSFQTNMVECIEDGGIPSYAHYKSNFGYTGVVLLYTFSVAVFIFNLSLFIFTIYKFHKSELFSKSKV